MSEIVKVVVEQESRGTAVKDTARDLEALRKQARAETEAQYPQTVQRKNELHRAAANYEMGGHADLAKSARADAQTLERDLRKATAERLGALRTGGAPAGEGSISQALADEHFRRGTNERLRAERAGESRGEGGEHGGEGGEHGKHEPGHEGGGHGGIASEQAANRRDWFEEQRILEARAKGDHKTAEEMERQKRVLEYQHQIKRDLGTSDERSLHLAHRRVAAEDAVAKAQQHHSGTRMWGDLLDRGTGSTGWVQTLGILKNAGPIGVAAMAAGAVYGIAGAFAAEQNEREGIRLRGIAAGKVQERELQRHASFEGSSAGSREAAEAYKDDLVAREANEPELERKAAPVWWNPVSWVKWATGANRHEILENEEGKERDKHGIEKEGEIKEKKWGEEGGLELEAARKRVNWDAAGARELEHKVLWRREYNRLLKEGAKESEAQEGATLKVHEAERKENQAFGRLVNARSGAGDIARAAAAASGEFSGRGGGGRQIVDHLAGLRHTVQEGQSAALHPHRL